MTISHKIAKRRAQVLTLRCQGGTIPAIQKTLEKNGLKVSEHTIWNDLHSSTADEFLEELKRQQLSDIYQEKDDSKLRLEYRGRIIDILSPKKLEQKIDGKIEQNVNVHADLTEYEHLIKTVGTEKTNLPKNDSTEQIHQT